MRHRGELSENEEFLAPHVVRPFASCVRVSARQYVTSSPTQSPEVSQDPLHSSVVSSTLSSDESSPCWPARTTPASPARRPHRSAAGPVTAWADAHRQGGTSSRICFYSSYLNADNRDYVKSQRLYSRFLHIVRFRVTAPMFLQLPPDLGLSCLIASGRRAVRDANGPRTYHAHSASSLDFPGSDCGTRNLCATIASIF